MVTVFDNKPAHQPPPVEEQVNVDAILTFKLCRTRSRLQGQIRHEGIEFQRPARTAFL